MFVECVIVALYFCLKVQEPLRIIIDTDNDGEGRTSRAILNVEPGVHFLLPKKHKEIVSKYLTLAYKVTHF